MFSGVYVSPEGIEDERPWLSEKRLAYAKQELEEALSSSAASQPLMGSLLIPCLLVNLLSSHGRTCKILDFGGGTGIAYFRLSPYLAHRCRVTWLVTDNRRLIDLGETYKRNGDNLFFDETIPNEPDIDIIFINTALQYVADSWSVLSALLERSPKFVVLTRLIAGDIRTHLTRQNNIQGGKAPCLFLNRDELVGFFAAGGFDLIHASYAGEDAWGPSHYENVPLAEQIGNTMNLVFKRNDIRPLDD